MTIAAENLKVEVRLAWWVNPLVRLLAAFYAITGLSPNVEKIQRLIMRGIRVQK